MSETPSDSVPRWTAEGPAVSAKKSHRLQVNDPPRQQSKYQMKRSQDIESSELDHLPFQRRIHSERSEKQNLFVSHWTAPVIRSAS